MLREHLAEAERRVAETEERVAQQRQLVLRLVDCGDADLAWAASVGLTEMQKLLASQIADRDRIAEELAKAGGTH